MAEDLLARVLCVDDNEDVVFSTVTLLEAFGFEVRGCTDGESALAVAADFHPTACVLDVSMPGMNGYQLAERLRAALGTVFLVAVTGTYGGDHDRRLKEAGFNLRLVKPADPAALFSAIANATARPEA